MKAYNVQQLRGAWGAGFAAAEAKIRQGEALLGCYFHTLRNGQINEQGKVIGKVAHDAYQVQLFSWITGEPTVRRVVPIQDMDDWVFYESRSEWIAAGDKAIGA